MYIWLGNEFNTRVFNLRRVLLKMIMNLKEQNCTVNMAELGLEIIIAEAMKSVKLAIEGRKKYNGNSN